MLILDALFDLDVLQHGVLPPLVHVQVILVLELPGAQGASVLGLLAALELDVTRQGVTQPVRFGTFGAHEEFG